VRLKYAFETMEMDDEIVAVPVGDGAEAFRGVVRLNESAAAIFALLKKDTTEEAIVAELLKKYETSEEELTRFVHQYVENLKKEGLLIA